MKLKMIVPMVLGFLFAVFILPRFANMTLAAKYKRSGVAYADEKEGAFTVCSAGEGEYTNVKEAISKVKCRKQMMEAN